MKTLLFIIIWLTSSNAQNIVPNGDFEYYDTLPLNFGKINNAVPWFSPNPLNGNPDFLYTGCGAVGLPDNDVAYVPVKLESNGCIGISMYDNNPTNITGMRRYACVQLITQMVMGHSYEIKLKVTNGVPKPSGYSFYGCDNFSVHFTVKPYTGQDNSDCIYLINSWTLSVPHYQYPGILYDTSWTDINFTFVADSAYSILNIGSFNPDWIQQVVLYGWSVSGRAYYFVDDVEVRDVSVAGIKEYSRAELHAYLKNYDLLGRLIRK